MAFFWIFYSKAVHVISFLFLRYFLRLLVFMCIRLMNAVVPFRERRHEFPEKASSPLGLFL